MKIDNTLNLRTSSEISVKLHYRRVRFQITQHQTVLYYQLPSLKQTSQDLTNQHKIALQLQTKRQIQIITTIDTSLAR